MRAASWAHRIGALALVVAAASAFSAMGGPDAAGDTVATRPPAAPVMRAIHLGFNPSAVLVDDATGRAFVVGDGRGVLALAVLDARTGRVVRTRSLGRSYLIPPGDGAPAAIDPRTGRVFLPTVTGKPAGDGDPATGPCVVRVLDGRTGASLRTIPAGYAPVGVTLAARARQLFLVNNARTDALGRIIAPGGLRVIDIVTGRLMRTHPSDDGPPLAVDERTNRVFVGSSTGLDMLDAATGRVLARVPLGQAPDSGAAAATDLAVDERAGRVVVALSGSLGLTTGLVLDATTGRVLHRAASVGSGPLAADPANGRAVSVDYPLSSTGGPVTASTFSTRDGHPVRTVTLDRLTSRGVAAAVAIDSQSGRAIVAREQVIGAIARPFTPTLITVIDLHSGRAMRTFALDDQPPAAGFVLDDQPPGPVFGAPSVAIDGRGRRAFVTNYGAGTVSVLDTARL